MTLELAIGIVTGACNLALAVAAFVQLRHSQQNSKVMEESIRAMNESTSAEFVPVLHIELSLMAHHDHRPDEVHISVKNVGRGPALNASYSVEFSTDGKAFSGPAWRALAGVVKVGSETPFSFQIAKSESSVEFRVAVICKDALGQVYLRRHWYMTVAGTLTTANASQIWRMPFGSSIPTDAEYARITAGPEIRTLHTGD